MHIHNSRLLKAKQSCHIFFQLATSFRFVAGGEGGWLGRRRPNRAVTSSTILLP